MSDIKVIEGLEDWEVMKRAGEGEPVAAKHALVDNGEWFELEKEPGIGCKFNFQTYSYAIIDITTPEIDWDKFDWDFFNQYGGLGVIFPDGPDMLRERISSIKDVNSGDIMLLESPFYYWPGGGQPVPDNVEAEIILRDGAKVKRKAQTFEWSVGGRDPGDIIAFKLTGKTCS